MTEGAGSRDRTKRRSRRGRPSTSRESNLGATTWTPQGPQPVWRALLQSRESRRQAKVIVVVIVGAALGLGALLAALRDDFRSYRDQMTTYVANATQHDSLGAAPYACAELCTAFEGNAGLWDAALRDQDLALGGLRLSEHRLRGRPDMASVVYNRNAGGEVTLHIRVVEEDGDLLMCPNADALFGEP